MYFIAQGLTNGFLFWGFKLFLSHSQQILQVDLIIKITVKKLMKNCFYICMYIVIESMLFRSSMEGFQFLCFYFKSDTKLKEYTIDEKEVSKILLQVAVARREAEIVSYLVSTLLLVHT